MSYLWIDAKAFDREFESNDWNTGRYFPPGFTTVCRAQRRRTEVSGTTELVLARHGEAHCNLAGLAGGEKTCTGLTDRGRCQAARLAARLSADAAAGAGADVLYAAPRRRVQETAQILGVALDLPVCTETGLNGPDHGEADGRPWAEIAEAFGGLPQSDPDRPYARGSETWNGYLSRVGSCLQQLNRKNYGS